MKGMQKTLAVMLATLLTASVAPINTLASYAAESTPVVTNEEQSEGTRITVKNSWGIAGNQATVVLSMENNPGIIGMTLKIAYNEDALTLVNAENGTAINGEGTNFTPPSTFSSGSNIVWADTSVEPDEISDGTLVTLTFEVKENAKLGDYPIVVSCSEAIANDLSKVPVSINSGSFSVINYIPGDTNGDGSIAMNDLVLLVRYIADGGYKEEGYAANINKSAADVNADRDVTAMDAVLLLRYIADGCECNPNGYNVTLLPAPFQCDHSSAKHIEAVEAPSCLEDGNVEYWYCEDCDKYFGDEACVNEISKEDTATKGEHTVVIDAAVAPTSEKEGLTEGSHCSKCGEVLIKQEVIPPLKPDRDYSITYNIAGSDTYLGTLNIQNPNPKTYSAGDTYKLKDLEVPGYTFEGWFDGQSEKANQVTSIQANDAGDLKLYAHWSLVTYHIDFDTDKTLKNPDIESKEYTVDRGATLPNMTLTGYYFMGWADENGNPVKSVPKGTYGNMTLYPIWTSHRNSTHPNDYASEGPAAITEWDDENGNTNISFVYNLGNIENVPLYQIGKWMNGSGVGQVEKITVSESFSQECSQNIAKAVSEATTNSSSWTLSKEWNETLEEDRSLNKTATEEQIAASQSYFSNTGSWCISSGVGNSETVSSSDGISSKTVDTEKGGVEASVGCNYMGIKAEVKAHADYETSREKGETHEHSRSATANWNSDESHSASSTAGGSSSFSTAISNSLSETERYGKIVSNAIGNSETNSSEQYQSSSNSYSNTFAYKTDEVKSTTIEYTLPVESYGYYRRVLVGTAYVFAVVNYNFATREFYVNTYSVIDDQSYNPYWDYSASTTDFTDHQLGVLPFAVPFEVSQYIGDLTLKTDGLTINKETGIVNGYTGIDTGVIIPQYDSYDNNDKTHTSVKVTGIAADAFAGKKDIVAVYLPDSVTEIPAGAFKGCTSLKKVVGKNIKSIGTRAFQNCTALENFTVESSVETLGKEAFDKAGAVTINASNSAVVSAVSDCGASSIVLNLKECNTPLENMGLNIPNTTKYFKLEGAGKTLTNFKIVSDAESTEIQNVTMNNTSGRPLVTSSKALTIGSSKITAPALAIVLLEEDTNITAYGQSSIVSNGEYAILSHNEAYSGTTGTDIPKFNITGNVAVCGEVKDEKYVNFTNGKFVKIDEDEFERLLNNLFTVSFDPKGGTVDKDSMQAYTETAIGKLPVPTKSDYIFVGWFTEDGTQVKDTTVFTEAKDIVLYAKWINFTLNKSSLKLNTDGKSKTYQLTSSYSEPDKVAWKSSDSTIATVNKGLVTALKDGSTTISATVEGVTISCAVVVKTAYNESWSAWSDWSTNKVDSSDTVQVEKEDRGSQVLVSYNMESYCTVANNPWRRQYRDFSVNGDYGSWGLSSTYGEHHNVWTFSVDEVNAATVIHPGEQQGGAQTGTNMANIDGYSMYFAEAYYIFFKKSENYDTVYTTYYRSRHLIKTPVEYEN